MLFSGRIIGLFDEGCILILAFLLLLQDACLEEVEARSSWPTMQACVDVETAVEVGEEGIRCFAERRGVDSASILGNSSPEPKW